jgi:hypothetical protein
MSETLVPRSLAGFDTYIRTAIPYLLQLEGADARHLRLGITDGEMDTAKGYRDQWWTGNIAAPGIYELHSNSATKTTVTREGVENIMKAFTPFFGNLLKRMATLTYTETDRQTLNIPQRDDVSTSRPAIGSTPVVGIEATGSGKIKFKVRISTDSDRPSMHPDADAIKIRYKIIATGDTPPANPSECTSESRSTRASFDLNADEVNAGKIICGFVNYINEVNPANDGPHSTLFSVMIT